MFIGICGSICAGKSTVAQYLVEHHGFRHLRVSEAEGGDGLGLSAAARLGLSEPVTNGGPNGTQGTNSHSKPNRPAVSKAASIEGATGLPLAFATAEEMLDFVTKRWRERWVTTHVLNERTLDSFSRRPFFVLISIDAPVTVRWRRFQQRQQGRSSEGSLDSLDAFVERSDAQLYDVESGQLPLMSRATVRLLNTSPDIAHLFATLAKVDLLNEDRLRPSWDTYFMALASLAAQRSNCMKRRVGCVLAREKRVISTGYNGTPRGLRNCGEGGCGRCNEGHSSGVGLATCMCIHAEENALLEAGRERIREGAILYCDTCPCLTCSIKIAQVGISEVVYSQGYSMDQATAAVLREAGVRLRQFVPPANGLIHLERTELY